MLWSYPVYLMRVLSSVMVGFLVISGFCADFIMHEILTEPCQVWCATYKMLAYKIKPICCELSTCPQLFVVIFFVSMSFIVGELFTELSDKFVLGPLFVSNSDKESAKGRLENVEPQRLKDHCGLFVALCPFSVRCFIDSSSESDEDGVVRIANLSALLSERERVFALSEMYYNMGRVMGGLLLLFWMLFGVRMVVSIAHCDFVSLGLAVVYVLLVYACFYLGKEQRKFANRLIYYS